MGCGYGEFSKYLSDQGHKVCCLDVKDEFRYDLPFEVFDGKHLPVDEKIVDTSCFHFVLHHTDNQESLLKEAIRCTREYLIITEDVIFNKLDKALGNIHLNTSPWARGHDSFRTDENWEKLFQSLGLKIVEKVNIPRNVYPIYPVHRIVYVLQIDS